MKEDLSDEFYEIFGKDPGGFEDQKPILFLATVFIGIGCLIVLGVYYFFFR